MHLTKCAVDSKAGPNLINEKYLKPQWKSLIERLELPKLETALKEVSKVQGLVSLVV